MGRVHQVELEAIARAQTGFVFATVELVDDLRGPDGTKLWGTANWKRDSVGIPQPYIRLEPDRDAYGICHSLLHECRHILIWSQREYLKPDQVVDIRTDVFAKLREEHPDEIERLEHNLDSHLKRVADPLVEEYERVEAECNARADLTLKVARENSETLGGAIRWLSENKIEEEVHDSE